MENYYGDDDAPMDKKPQMGGADKGKPEADDGADEGLLPKEFFGGEPQVGQKCTVEITHVGDEDVVVKYISDQEPKEAPASEMSRSNSQMDALATDE